MRLTTNEILHQIASESLQIRAILDTAYKNNSLIFLKKIASVSLFATSTSGEHVYLSPILVLFVAYPPASSRLTFPRSSITV